MPTLELRTARLTLRPTCDGDIAVLAAILATPEVGRWWPDYDAERVRVELVEPDSDNMVGYAVLTFGYDLEFGGRDAYLTELYVTPEARGRGVATAALAEIAAAARGAGAGAVNLAVRVENLPARAAYRRAGFAETGRDLMTLRLDP